MSSLLPKMKILLMLARNYEKLDIELLPIALQNHVWFLYGMLLWAKMGQKRLFINADFKLEFVKMFHWKFC